jgi:hypothetical protein
MTTANLTARHRRIAAVSAGFIVAVTAVIGNSLPQAHAETPETLARELNECYYNQKKLGSSDDVARFDCCITYGGTWTGPIDYSGRCTVVATGSSPQHSGSGQLPNRATPNLHPGETDLNLK